MSARAAPEPTGRHIASQRFSPARRRSERVPCARPVDSAADPSRDAIETRLPDGVTAFIRDHINSIEQLGVLLLLRAQSGRAWTAPELSGELKTTPASVARRLESLERHGLAARNGGGGFRFERAHAAAVDELAACYATRRVAVIEAIFSVEREADAAVPDGR